MNETGAIAANEFAAFGAHSRISTCLVLSIDHDLNRLRKLRPSSRLPFTEATLPGTFSKALFPTFSDLIRNICEGTSVEHMFSVL